MIPLREYFVRRMHPGAERVLAFDKRLLEGRGGRVCEVVPQKLEEDPFPPLFILRSTPRDGYRPPALIFGGELDLQRLLIATTRSSVVFVFVARIFCRRIRGRHYDTDRLQVHGRHPIPILPTQPGPPLPPSGRFGPHAPLYLVQDPEEFIPIDIAAQNKHDIVGGVVLGVVASNLGVGQRSQVPHLAARLGAVPARIRIEQVEDGSIDEGTVRILPALHLAVDHALVLPLRRDVMDLGEEALVGHGRVQYVIGIDGEQIERTLLPGRREGVRRVIRRRPRVRAVGEGTVGELVEDALERVEVGAEEDGMLEGVGEAVVLVGVGVGRGLGGDDDVEGAEGFAGRYGQTAKAGVGGLVQRRRVGEEGRVDGGPFCAADYAGGGSRTGTTGSSRGGVAGVNRHC
mmetsp:Transcript_13215/g.27979  ORF Transcript_13215/g.27979 Transcript_13215/m.27979 type:complete len:402 (-) Transcript_13215:182-1387(-)